MNSLEVDNYCLGSQLTYWQPEKEVARYGMARKVGDVLWLCEISSWFLLVSAYVSFVLGEG